MLTYNTNSNTGPVCGGRARARAEKRIVAAVNCIAFFIFLFLLLVIQKSSYRERDSA